MHGLRCPEDVGSSQGRDCTCVSCISWWILNHWMTREAEDFLSLGVWYLVKAKVCTETTMKFLGQNDMNKTFSEWLCYFISVTLLPYCLPFSRTLWDSIWLISLGNILTCCVPHWYFHSHKYAIQEGSLALLQKPQFQFLDFTFSVIFHVRKHFLRLLITANFDKNLSDTHFLYSLSEIYLLYFR